MQEWVLMLEHMDDAPLHVLQVRKWRATDVTLSQVHCYILNGWPETNDPELMAYYSWCLELSAQDGCILWGACTVIPLQG